MFILALTHETVLKHLLEYNRLVPACITVRPSSHATRTKRKPEIQNFNNAERDKIVVTVVTLTFLCGTF
jgi:hypothetical protein